MVNGKVILPPSVFPGGDRHRGREKGETERQREGRDKDTERGERQRGREKGGERDIKTEVERKIKR